MANLTDRSCGALEDAVFERFDLTSQQYNALRLLAAAPGKLRTLDLASRLISRAPDITRMLDKLESRGFIDRDRPATNRRTVEIGITEKGRTLLEELRVPIRDCHRAQLGHLSPKQLRELIALLRAVRDPHEDVESLWR